MKIHRIAFEKECVIETSEHAKIFHCKAVGSEVSIWVIDHETIETHYMSRSRMHLLALNVDNIQLTELPPLSYMQEIETEDNSRMFLFRAWSRGSEASPLKPGTRLQWFAYLIHQANDINQLVLHNLFKSNPAAARRMFQAVTNFINNIANQELWSMPTVESISEYVTTFCKELNELSSDVDKYSQERVGEFIASLQADLSTIGG